MKPGRNRSADDNERSATRSATDYTRGNFARNNGIRMFGDMLDRTRAILSWIENVGTSIARTSSAIASGINVWNTVSGLLV